MSFWIITVPGLPANGMAIFPFILIKNPSSKQDPILINHEKIHLRQQLELLILPFYFFYFFNYLINFLRYRNHYQAYFNILFEREAFHADKDLGYLKKRKFMAWIGMINKPPMV